MPAYAQYKVSWGDNFEFESDSNPSSECFAQVAQPQKVMLPSPLNWHTVRTDSLTEPLNGEIKIRFLLDRQGRYVQHEILAGRPDATADHAIGLIKSLKFSPARFGPDSLCAWLTWTIRYQGEHFEMHPPVGNIYGNRQRFPDPDAFMMFEHEPILLNSDEVWKAIGYPEEAGKMEIEGKVILRLLIDNDGSYVRHIVIRDPHPVLTGPVEAQIPKMRFSPAMQEGVPVPAWLTIPWNIRLLR